MFFRTRFPFKRDVCFSIRIVIISFVFLRKEIGGLYDTQGPAFLSEPPNKLEFINSNGGKADCVARGNPLPSVEWVGQDNVRISSVPSIRHILTNGTIYFPPFDADAFRQDVHWTVYRCVVSNIVGTIFSRDVVVRAVVNQRYEPEVQSPGGFLNNNVVFRCSVPSFVKEHVSVTSWLQKPAFYIYPSTMSDGKYHMLPTGELMIINITRSDAQRTYQCRTHHRLTQEAALSRNEGRIQLSDMRSSVPPILNRKLIVITAKAEDTVVTPCVAYANPRPEYKWFYKRNQQEIVIENLERFMVRDGTLVISNVKKSDSGVYYCRASNKEGSETLELQLSVMSPLSVHIHPTSQTSHLGKSAEFECTIHGFPHTTIYWLKDGQPIRFGARIRQVTDTRLRIVSVTKEDRGMYQCVVRNDIEMSQGSAELRLGEVYPHLAYKFIEQTMQPGPSVSLKCSASGNPTPQITWLLDGFPLPHSERLLIGQYVTLFGDVVSHVNISSVKAEDGGEYECIAENRAGKTSHSARLNIYGLPYVRPMSPISAVAGKDLVVKCPVAGYPIETVIWEKDGMRLPTTLRQRVSNNSLIIENVQRDADQGSYTCIARNKQGHNSQKTVQIRVIVPPRISPFYFEERVVTGMRTQVMCSASQGDRPFNITWSKDGHDINGGDISISDFAPFSSILTIDNVASSHSGNYTCTVRNDAGRAQYTANLSVTVPPKWVVEPPREQSVILGNAISLHCQADGFPKPTVTWKQATGTLIKSNNVQPGPDEYRELSYNTPNTIRLENGTLAILRASEDHEGYFMCEANNGVGAGISKFIHLVVHAGPRFHLRSRQEAVKKGDTVHLRCEAEGDLPMDIVWKVRGSQIDGGYDQRYLLKNTSLTSGFMSELTIIEVGHRDRGEYMCVASNAYGHDHTMILLLVQEPPSFPRNLHVADQTSRSITLSWSPPTSPSDATINEYILQFKEARDIWHEHGPQKMFPGNKTMAIITGLKPATMYHFRLFAVNDLGQSAPSDVLHGVTEGEPPAGPPQQVKAEPMSPTQLRITWQPPDRNLWNGDLLGYNIGFKKLKNENEDYNWTHFRESTGLPGDFRLINLSKFTKYSIVITAVNAKGDGPPSDPITAETMEDVPSAPPQDIQCGSLTAQSLQLNWRSPPSSKAHGLIQGYKVLYEPADEWFETPNRETKITSSLSTSLHGLQPYTNYSVQLLAFTRAGDGVRSPVIFCMTDEATPEAPAAVKAIVSSEESVIVSWLPPRRLNGVLTKYTVYIRIMDKGTELKTVKNTLPAQSLHYEAIGLKKRETYEAWVTASTKIGQGQSTAIVQLIPSSMVPAAIISFGRLVVVPWKTEVRLPCLHVGQPRPMVEWRLTDVKLTKHSKAVVIEDRELRIENVGRVNEGNYSCHVKNNLGSDHIIFALVVQVPPTPPILLTTAVTTDSVQLQWKQGDSGGAAVRGFILYFRKEGGEWEELILEPRMTTYLMEGLDCGTSYQFRLTAYNKIGSGVASKLISIVTKGSRPIPPSKAHFLSINSSATLLHLRTWGDGGCPLTHFSLSFRRPSGNWIQVPGTFEPSQDYLLSELLPGTEYVVKVNAHNSAGVTTQDYIFTTLLPHGGPSAPNSAISEDEQIHSTFYVDTQIVVLGAVSILSLLLAVTGICFCLHKRPEREDICLPESQSTAALDNKRNMEQREQYYTTVRKPSQSPCRDIGALERIPEYSEDIYPYATFHLPEQESMAGNPQRQSYLYESQLKQPDSDHYGKSRSGRIRRKSKSLKSESEEYDSLGSDTDTEHGTSSRTESSNHLCDNSNRYPINQSTIGRHRKKDVDDHSSRYVARLAVQGRPPHHSMPLHHHTAGSGTSTEPSPIFERRDRCKISRRRYGYEDNTQNGMEITFEGLESLLSSIK